jgi:hypothetical protein
MEADDDLVPAPDSKGFLDLTNRAWVHLDPHIWTLSVQLVVLDISYNHIHEIPPQIGQLVLLKELRASFNKITSIPDTIGRYALSGLCTIYGTSPYPTHIQRPNRPSSAPHIFFQAEKTANPTIECKPPHKGTFCYM